ncbi:Prion-like-(Q N-rich) domain-bearing 25 isoform C [Micractinium conductrix]|uniref:Prion-like-(Q N-rich) domain-bearing 25 isoform C n=1 Tax=Micractinium conductrix TaxID=554055 RepID=A0A2P6VQV0_9CHLO|nr:Prion-like-(Q N-rich) domain-bearing 25 isoform C [Micractinium conductrix]|eukprot:PSC76474.1 Prion-like-(Q N-rich) domain-bearing 25 isoform C [Micractinium conductrix]
MLAPLKTGQQKGETKCGVECADTNKGKDHCGNCETRCMGDAECRAGKCVQPAAAKAAADEEPATVRGQVKADERTPETAAAVEVASATKAAAVEPAPAAKAADGDAVGVDDKEEERKCPTDAPDWCAGSCADTVTSKYHCGGCYRPCFGTKTCVHGACTSPAPSSKLSLHSWLSVFLSWCKSWSHLSGCPPGQKRCPGSQNCIPNGDCCPGDSSCNPPGQKKCNGKCIPIADCCKDEECEGGKTCSDGQCACGDGDRQCGNACIPNERCCSDDDCGGGKICDPSTKKCRCPKGHGKCGETCIPRDRCCKDSDCDEGQACSPAGKCKPRCKQGKRITASGVLTVASSRIRRGPLPLGTASPAAVAAAPPG